MRQACAAQHARRRGNGRMAPAVLHDGKDTHLHASVAGAEGRECWCWNQWPGQSINWGRRLLRGDSARQTGILVVMDRLELSTPGL